MTDDPDIRRAALYMIQLKAEQAEASARNHAQALLLDRQFNAAALWQQIADAILELLKRD